MPKFRFQNFLKFIVYFLLLLVYSQLKAQNNEQTTQYHYDENNRIKLLKKKLKEYKKTPIPDSLNEEKKEKFIDNRDSIIDAGNDIIDSLEYVEYDKMINVLHQVNKPTHFEFDNCITNKNYFNGRALPIVGLCYNPSITFKHNSGFYTQLLFYQYPEDEVINAEVPEWDILFGFGKSITENFYLDINYSYSKLYYGTTPSLLANNFTINGTYDFDIFSAGSDFMILWGGTINVPASEKSSTLVSPFIDKNFSFNHFLGSYYFTIDPELTFDLGSDNLFQVRKNLVKEKKKTVVKKVPVETTFWGLLAVDATVNLNYRIRNFDFYFIPHYIIPYNVLNDKNIRVNGASTPLFYFTTGITYRFKLWSEPSNNKQSRISHL